MHKSKICGPNQLGEQEFYESFYSGGYGPFHSIRNCKRHKEENFRLKFYSNKMMLCWDGG